MKKSTYTGKNAERKRAPGAGRPVGSGKYGTATRTMRVPENQIDNIRHFLASNGGELPLYDVSVVAGIPEMIPDSPLCERVNVLENLTPNPESAFMVRVKGDSMIKAKIFDGDILIVEPDLQAKDGDIVVAAYEDQCTVKRLKHINGKPHLMPENDAYAPIPIEGDLHIIGVSRKRYGEIG